MGMGLTIGSCIQLINWSVFKRRDAERKSCRGCKYRKQIGSDPKDTACLYLFITGKRRGCPAESCDRYEKKKTAALSPQKHGSQKTNYNNITISQSNAKSQQNAWRETHREELLAYQKAYYAANKERIAERQKVYRAAHKEKARAYQKAYYAAHREKELARQKAYRGRRSNANEVCKVAALNGRGPGCFDSNERGSPARRDALKGGESQ